MPLNTRGVYMYAETDTDAKASDMLNRRATEEAAIPWVPLILKAGFTGTAAVCIVGGIVYFRGYIVKSSGSFPASGSGDLVATLPGAQYRVPSYTRLLLPGWASTAFNGSMLTLADNNSDVYLATVGASAVSTSYLAGISYRAA